MKRLLPIIALLMSVLVACRSYSSCPPENYEECRQTETAQASVTHTEMPTETEFPTIIATITPTNTPVPIVTLRPSPTPLPPLPTPTPCAYGIVIDRLVNPLTPLKFRTEPRIAPETWTGKVIPELELVEAGCYYVQDNTTEWFSVLYQGDWGWIVYVLDLDGDGLGELLSEFYDF